MTRQNVTRLQSSDCNGKTLSAVRQRNSEDRKIDPPKDGFAVANMFDSRWCIGHSARVDVNSFAGSFDQKRERLAHGPVRRFYWFGRCGSSRKGNFAEKTIVLCG